MRDWVGCLLLVALAGCGPSAAPPPKPVERGPFGLVAGQPGELEFTVVQVKFAPRRKIHFLSSSTNLRGPENQIVAIREADFPKFESAGLGDLETVFHGHRIRAQGTAAQDEGQWLLFIDRPDQIEIVLHLPDEPAAPPPEREKSRYKPEPGSR